MKAACDVLLNGEGGGRMRNKVDQNRLCWPIMDRNVACERKADVYTSHKQHQGQSVCKSASSACGKQYKLCREATEVEERDKE